MSRRIFLAIFGCSAIIVVLAICLFAAGLFSYYFRNLQDQLRNELALAVRGTELDGSRFLDGFSDADFRLTWVAPDGRVLYDTRTDAATMDNHAARYEITAALTDGSSSTVRFSETLLRQTMYLAARLTDGSVLRISQEQLTFAAVLLRNLPSFLILILLALILSPLLASQAARQIVKPVNAMNLADPFAAEVYPELKPLASRLMAQQTRIGEQMQELQTQAAELQQITENMTEGLFLVDRSGRIRQLNQAAKEIFGMENDVSGLELQVLDRSQEMKLALARAFSEGTSRFRESRSGRYYEVRISAIRPSSDAAGAVVLFLDDTERVQAEQWRQEFSANVSHELKTPLQAIIGSVDLLQHGMAAPEDVPHFLDRIRAESERLSSLAQDILFLSQLDEGIHMEHEDLNLLALLREAAADLEPVAARQQISLHTDGCEVHIIGVRRALKALISNLLDNAIRYNVVGGSVNAEICLENNHPVLRVCDTGIGIPAEYQDRVFERFFRVDKSRSRESGGTGLGLSIVKHAAALHEADISIRSTSSGTCIEVRFLALEVPNLPDTDQ